MIYYHGLEWLIEDWLETTNELIDDPDQIPVPSENLIAERGVTNFEPTLCAAEPDAAQAAATTWDDQPVLWNSRFDSDTFTALISRNDKSSGLQSAADLEQLKHIQQKPITS
ncbi:unnamed protein product [Gongylonema pulchrum]|uniref:Anaphase-promoting complex subunit 13 n=1 Tax=Gongylonema pulchrum TaxID=637853 RepID=A0A183DWT9_9BILA|nr:unnamed protein product [Gongylonema pulchrum]